MWAPTQRVGLLALFNTPAGGGSHAFIDLPRPLRLRPDADGGPSAYTSAATLALLGGVKWVLKVCSLLLPLLAGTFMPIFQTGAALGRAAAEALTAALRGRVAWLDPRA